MDILKINKALSNQTRLDILKWLKDPELNFPPHRDIGHFNFGVCQVYIQEKAGLSQSTISLYMSQLHQAGLVTPTRIGKWTYFKRNEEGIRDFVKSMEQEL